MTVSVTVTGIESILAEELRILKIVGQAAMAEKFFEITRENFGDTGVDRPLEWANLSPKYARRVGRDHATLFLSGELESSLNFDGTNPEFSEVWTDNDYALAHQFGNPSRNLPPRPFMPLTNESDSEYAELTDYAAEQVVAAAQAEIDRIVK